MWFFFNHSGSMAMKNKAADNRLKAHAKGVTQGVQLYVLAARHRPTMPLQRRLDLNALGYADAS